MNFRAINKLLLCLSTAGALTFCAPASPAPSKEEGSEFETEELKVLELETDNKMLRQENVKLRNDLSAAKAELDDVKAQHQEEIEKYKRMAAAIEEEQSRLRSSNASDQINYIEPESIAKEPEEELSLDKIIPTPLSSKAVKTASLTGISGSDKTGSSQGKAQPGAFFDSAVEPSARPIKTTSVQSAKKDYDKGYALYLKKNYSEAIEAFNVMLRKFAHDDYADNALFWLGMSYWQMNDRSAASRYFREILTKYNHGPPNRGFKTADAIFMLGKIAKEQKQQEKALFYFKTIRNKFPGTIPAQMALSEAPELEQIE